MRTLLVRICPLLLLLSISCSSRPFVEFNRPLQGPPAGWTNVGLPRSSNLRITFVLNIQNEAYLEELFWAVSDPDSPRYANYLSYSSIVDHFSASLISVLSLTEWLSEYGLTPISITPTRDFVTVDIPLKIAEEIFQVKFNRFQHPHLGEVTRSLDPYTLPDHIHPFVSFVTGINRFPGTGRIAPIKTQLNEDTKASIEPVTPQVIWSTFKTNGTVGLSPDNLQGVAQFLQEYYDPQDLSDFQTFFHLDQQPVAKLIGPNDPQNTGGEALLDTEYIMGTAPHVPTWFWSTDGLHDGQEPFVEWAQYMNNVTTVPYVMSVSYADDESSVSKEYTDRLNIELKKLAVRGVSVLYSSGDSGVGCTQNCANIPTWPPSSPYVTSVGGFTNPSNITADFISGGGFSNYYPSPPYQTATVQAYLSTNPLPPSSQFNITGRAYPDVSSFSEGLITFINQKQYYSGGTSCATPVFSGIISLINDKLLLLDKKPVGFLNTALYKIGLSNPLAFIDVTTGGNPASCCKGFTASVGWDPVTGLGGPNFPVLFQEFLSFQNRRK